MINYFIPNVSSVSDDDISRYKLGYAFESGSPRTIVPVRAGRGPKNQSGVIVSTQNPEYDPSTQDWFEHPVEGVHFGWSKQSKPSPKSLERRQTLPGTDVRLNDGNKWVIPMAKQWILEENQPKWRNRTISKLDYVGGEWVQSDVIQEHQLFYDIGEKIFDSWHAQISGDMSGTIQLPDGFVGMCSDVLAINYRVSPIEIAKLGLLNSSPDLLWSILKSVIDVEGWVAILKKTEVGTPGT